MKSVLISIQPKWCELIAKGEKTIEVRKNRPKIETPFKCYIYCTKQRMTKVPCMYSYLHINEPKASLRYEERITTWGNIGDIIVNRTTPYEYVSYGMKGKVIGEFVCDRIICSQAYFDSQGKNHLTNVFEEDIKRTCLTEYDLWDYIAGKSVKANQIYDGYLWHISDLKIYDKPKPIMQFYKPCPMMFKNCPVCEFYSKDTGACMNNIDRPPQSFCYVEE